jgi:hypothetical protein
MCIREIKLNYVTNIHELFYPHWPLISTWQVHLCFFYFYWNKNPKLYCLHLVVYYISYCYTTINNTFTVNKSALTSIYCVNCYMYRPYKAIIIHAFFNITLILQLFTLWIQISGCNNIFQYYSRCISIIWHYRLKLQLKVKIVIFNLA